jgi:hypothetical protein
MIRSLPLLCLLLVAFMNSSAQVQSDELHWLVYQDGTYSPISDKSNVSNTVYFKVDLYRNLGAALKIESAKPYFIFINGQLITESSTEVSFRLDSLADKYSSPMLVGIYQDKLNPRSLNTTITLNKKVSAGDDELSEKPVTYFRDFATLTGLMLIVLFVSIINLNPKLASDYFSVVKIFSLREVDDAQSNARLTSSANIQFYIACSLLIGFFLLLILRHLPDDYALPLRFSASSFWQIMWQWLRLSMIVLMLFGFKIFLVFNLTRLFDMKGVARIHFFNWVRLMLIVIGVCTVVVFVYYISRGQYPGFFSGFLAAVTCLLIAWIIVVFMKLNGKTEHSMFHLFSYICATEIIPLVITIKVLFQ